MSAPEVCLLNIGPAQRKKRLRAGLAAYALGAAALAAQLVLGADAPWRLALLPLWLLGGYGVLQARAKT